MKPVKQETGQPEAGIQTGLPGVGGDHIKRFPGKGQANQLSMDDLLELNNWKEEKNATTNKGN